MNKVMASIVSIALAIFLAGCDTTVPYSELSAEEKNALTIKPVEGVRLTRTEGEYRYWFAWGCARPWSQFETEFAKIAQGTQYASKFKHSSQENAKVCAESPQSAKAKDEWVKKVREFAQRLDEETLFPFLRSTSSEKRAEVGRVANCRKELQVAMQEMAQLGVNQNPSRAKRINRLYDSMVRDQKRMCENTSNTQRFLRASDAFWANRITPLRRAVEGALGI